MFLFCTKRICAFLWIWTQDRQREHNIQKLSDRTHGQIISSTLAATPHRILDYKKCIFRNLDKKSPLPERLETHHAKLSILKKRVDIRWGHVSLIKAEISLFESASANGPYGYYHLLSGADLPIKSQDYIFDFFEKNAGKEFVGFTQKTDLK